MEKPNEKDSADTRAQDVETKVDGVVAEVVAGQMHRVSLSHKNVFPKLLESREH